MIGDHYIDNVGMPIKAAKIKFKNILSTGGPPLARVEQFGHAQANTPGLDAAGVRRVGNLINANAFGVAAYDVV